MFNTRLTVVGVLIAALAAVSVVQTVRLANHKTYHAEYVLSVQDQLLQSNLRARELEQEVQRAADEAARVTAERMHNAHQDAISDLRSRNLRLQNHWRACEATSRVSKDSRSTSMADAGAAARERDREYLLGRGRYYDEWIRGLQRHLRAIESGQ